MAYRHTGNNNIIIIMIIVFHNETHTTVHTTVTQPNGSIIVAAMHLLFELVVLPDELREHLPAESTVD